MSYLSTLDDMYERRSIDVMYESMRPLMIALDTWSDTKSDNQEMGDCQRCDSLIFSLAEQLLASFNRIRDNVLAVKEKRGK